MQDNLINEIPNAMEEHLKHVDVLELTRRIKHFRSLNIKSMSDHDLRNELLNVLTWDGRFYYCFNSVLHLKQFPLYRVRKLDGSVIPIENFKKTSDLWEPPADILTKYGRLNKSHESLLYVAPDPNTAIKETQIQKDDYFALILYDPKVDIKLNYIGGEYDYSAMGVFDKHAILVHEIYNNFLRDEFSRDVGAGTEYLYRVSEMIAKDYFDLPPRIVQDAWAYSSIQDKNKCNICFRPDIAHEVLEVRGAMLCKHVDPERINVRCIAVSNDNGALDYFLLGSPMQKKLFPDITFD